MIHVILLALAPVFFVLALGYGAGRLRIVNNQQIDSLNALVMNFAVPASLFVATASASKQEMLDQAPLFGILGGVMVLLWLISYAFRRAVTKASSADASLQALTIAYPNLAGVGLPIVAAVLGSAGAVPVAVALAAGSILVTPLALILIEVGNGKSGGAASAFRHALTRPVVLAPALGMLISLLDWNLGAVLAACFTLIGHAAAGVALFLTGLILSAQSFRLNRNVIIGTGMADVVRPLLTAALVFALPVAPETAKTAILLASVPSGFFGILFAVNYRLDSGTPGSMVLASTVFSIATMAISIAVLFPH